MGAAPLSAARAYSGDDCNARGVDLAAVYESARRGASLLGADPLELLLDRKADPNMTEEDGTTPLMLAAKHGSCAAVKLLLKAEADPNRALFHNDRTPLYFAAQGNHADIVKLLLRHGADPTVAEGSCGMTPVYIAAANNSAAALEILLQDTSTRRHRELGRRLHRDSAAPAMVCRADPDTCEQISGASPVFAATLRNNVEALEVLLSHKADPNTPDANGCTPVYVAAEEDRLETLRLLLTAKASAETGSGKLFASPAEAAQGLSNSDCLKLLLNAKAHLSLSPLREHVQPPLPSSGAGSSQQRDSSSPISKFGPSGARVDPRTRNAGWAVATAEHLEGQRPGGRRRLSHAHVRARGKRPGRSLPGIATDDESDSDSGHLPSHVGDAQGGGSSSTAASALAEIPRLWDVTNVPEPKDASSLNAPRETPRVGLSPRVVRAAELARRVRLSAKKSGTSKKTSKAKKKHKRTGGVRSRKKTVDQTSGQESLLTQASSATATSDRLASSSSAVEGQLELRVQFKQDGDSGTIDSSLSSGSDSHGASPTRRRRSSKSSRRGSGKKKADRRTSGSKTGCGRGRSSSTGSSAGMAAAAAVAAASAGEFSLAPPSATRSAASKGRHQNPRPPRLFDPVRHRPVARKKSLPTLHKVRKQAVGVK